ncbi:transcriptional regulator GcvA [Inquilinus sp. NPDC058860]|uniref:transcriptional regulator GcvA n=1 Tax=Inquilinus sp. NPDC058860 TaxID=3346652 RepID=UPI0036B4C168
MSAVPPDRPTAAIAPPEAAPPREGRAGRRAARLPQLNLFRVFDAAAQHHSFTAAADELCVTQSAVSQQIRQLEEFLEVRLFRRLPRRLELTREGTALAGVVHEALAMLGRACDRIADPATPTVLCVNAAPALASRWLVPRLKRFMETHPLVKVTLLASNDPVDFDRQDIDVAIRWGSGRWPGVRAEPMGREPIFPVCSPSLLPDGRPLRRAEELSRHTLLQVVHGHSWTAWQEAAGGIGVDLAESLYFSDASLMLEAAAQGQGVGLSSYLLVESELKSGRLVRAFETELTTEDGYYILSSPEYGDKPAIANFRAWIRAEAEAAIDGRQPISSK